MMLSARDYIEEAEGYERIAAAFREVAEIMTRTAPIPVTVKAPAPVAPKPSRCSMIRRAATTRPRRGDASPVSLRSSAA